MKQSIQTEVWRRAQRGHFLTWVAYAQNGMARSGTRTATWHAILAAVAREAPLRQSERILDIGCGLDTVLDFIPDVRGFTLDSLTAALRPLGLSPAARHTAGVFEAMPFANGVFDRVFLMNVLDHVQNPGAGLDELARVLAPEGVLVLSVDTYDGLRYYQKRLHKWWARVRGARTKHPWVFSVANMRSLLRRAGFAPGAPSHVAGTKTRRTLFVARKAAAAS